MKRLLATAVLGTVILFAAGASAWVHSVATVSPRDAARQIQRAQGQVRIVMLYSISCPHCRTMFPEFVAVAQRYKPEGVAVMTFATDDEPARVEEFLGRTRVPFSTAVIERKRPGELADALRPTGIDLGDGLRVPYVAVIDRNGAVIGQTSGSGGARRLEAWLRSAGIEAR